MFIECKSRQTSDRSYGWSGRKKLINTQHVIYADRGVQLPPSEIIEYTIIALVNGDVVDIDIDYSEFKKLILNETPTITKNRFAAIAEEQE